MKIRISRPTTDVKSARCVLRPVALFKATNSPETIHAEAMMAAVTMTGENGIAIRMKRTPGDVEKNIGRASCQ
jgi:hypothetical protein